MKFLLTGFTIRAANELVILRNKTRREISPSNSMNGHKK